MTAANQTTTQTPAKKPKLAVVEGAEKAAPKVAKAPPAAKAPPRAESKAERAAPPATAKEAPAKQGRAPKFAGDAVVVFDRKKNPHSKKTKNYKVWEKLNSVPGNKVTVEKALAAGVNRGYLTYMVGRGEMEVEA